MADEEVVEEIQWVSALHFQGISSVVTYIIQTMLILLNFLFVFLFREEGKVQLYCFLREQNVTLKLPSLQYADLIMSVQR